MNQDTYNTLQRVLAAIRSIRVNPSVSEAEIHAAISKAFTACGVVFRHEVTLALRNRIDFAVGRIGVEVKKGKPNSQSVRRQLERYAASPDLDAFVLVVERSVASAPLTVSGKAVEYVSLNKLWGIAL